MLALEVQMTPGIVASWESKRFEHESVEQIDTKKSLIDILKADPRAKIVGGNGGGLVITGVKPPDAP